MRKKSEFQIVKEIEKKLGLENLTDGTLKIYNGMGLKHDKPDGRFEYKDIVIVLDAKAEGNNYAEQLADYIKGERKKEPKKNVFGIFYNGVSHYVYLNSINDILHKMGLTDLLDRMV
jgi:hypothetical protein